MTTAKPPEQDAVPYAAIVESCEYGILTETLDGVITSWNHAAELMYGYPADEMIGKHTSILIDPSGPDETVEILKRIRHDERVPHFETTRRRKNGTRVLVALTVSPIRDSNGKIVGASTVARDIRDRKLVEAELRRSSHYSRSLIEASLDPLAMISPDGKLTDVNEATVTVTGVSRDELIGTDFAGYFTEPDKARIAYQHTFEDGSVTDYPLTVRRADGRTIYVLFNASLYRDLGGNVLGVFAAARDVTALRQVQADLERSNVDLERSNADLEQFAYVASHDLAEPLRAISGPISLVARKYRGALDPVADEFIDFAVDGCVRMQRIIDTLLAYSRVGRVEGAVKPVDSALLMNEVLDGLSATVAESGAKITVGPLPVVNAEPSQLSQVFQNLLSNAMKFVAHGVRPEISVAARQEGQTWRFSVTDNGIGVEAPHRDQIFRMFERLKSREEYPGTGIGLALTKKIVERHGGSIGMEPAPTGTGSCFWFTLPT